MLVMISTVHRRAGLLWNRFKEHYGKESNVLVVRGTTLQFNPTFDEETIKAALQSDPQQYGAEYNSEWRSDLQAFVNRDAVEACVVEGRYELGPIPGVSYKAFVDPSGGSADSMTLAVAHKQDNRAVLDLVREWKPPFSPEGVVAECADILRPYGVTRVVGDRYGGLWVREPFVRRGIAYKLSELEKSRIYQAFLPLINSGRVELLDLPKLISQLASLERRVSRGGRDSIDHPKGGHDDVANCCAGVAELAIGPIPYPPAQFTSWGYRQPQNRRHKWDGPTPEGGYASSR